MKVEATWSLLRFFITFVVLYAVWLLFSARVDLFSLLSGLVGALLISLVTYKVFIAEHEASFRFVMPRFHRLFIFFFVLVYYMYASSVKMMLAVFHGRVNPRIVHFRTRLHSDLARMVLANSITFTPGTITLDLNEDHLTVHWFFSNTRHAKRAGEEVKGRMEDLLGKVWV